MTKKSVSRLNKDATKRRDAIQSLQAAVALLHLRVKHLEQAMLDAVPVPEAVSVPSCWPAAEEKVVNEQA